MCCFLVSAFLTEITQQIHSLRASGVMSSHFARASESDRRAFRKSAGRVCNAPCETTLFIMNFILYLFDCNLSIKPAKPWLIRRTHAPGVLDARYVFAFCRRR